MHDGKLLAVRLKPYNEVSVKMQQSWCLPGGGLEEREALLAGIEREMLEETGVKAKIGKILYIQQFTYNNVDYLEFFFHIKNSQDFLNVDLTKTSHGSDELEEIGYVNAAATTLLPSFLMTEDLLDKITNNSPVTIISYKG